MRTLLRPLLGVGGMSAMLVAQERTIDVEIVEVPYDMEELVRPSDVPDDVVKGRAVWVQRCAFCHDGLGTPTYNTLGPWLDAALVELRGEEAVRTKILNGSATMPGFQYGLSEEQVDQLIALLKTITPDQQPTEAQKAGKAPLPGDL